MPRGVVAQRSRPSEPGSERGFKSNDTHDKSRNLLLCRQVGSRSKQNLLCDRHAAGVHLLDSVSELALKAGPGFAGATFSASSVSKTSAALRPAAARARSSVKCAGINAVEQSGEPIPAR